MAVEFFKVLTGTEHEYAAVPVAIAGLDQRDGLLVTRFFHEGFYDSGTFAGVAGPALMYP